MSSKIIVNPYSITLRLPIGGWVDNPAAVMMMAVPNGIPSDSKIIL